MKTHKIAENSLWHIIRLKIVFNDKHKKRAEALNEINRMYVQVIRVELTNHLLDP